MYYIGSEVQGIYGINGFFKGLQLLKIDLCIAWSVSFLVFNPENPKILRILIQTSAIFDGV
jgi:hypothetical protein